MTQCSERRRRRRKTGRKPSALILSQLRTRRKMMMYNLFKKVNTKLSKSHRQTVKTTLQ